MQKLEKITISTRSIAKMHETYTYKYDKAKQVKIALDFANFCLPQRQTESSRIIIGITKRRNQLDFAKSTF